MPLALERPTHPVTGRPALVIDVYCRISKDYDGTTRSVESQEEDCLDEIAERQRDGWMLGQVFRDHAKSAWNPKVIRKDWELLMERLEGGLSDGILVYDLSRFTRKPKEGERLIDQAARGIIVASIENSYNLQDPDGRNHFRQDMAAAARESDKISQRTTRGKVMKARRGKSNASRRGFALPGYKPRPEGWIKTEESDPPVPECGARVAREIEAVREMARRIIAGESLDSVARDYNRRGILTVNDREWTGRTLKQMLMRPSLANLIEYKGSIVGAMQTENESPLDEQTWADLQRRFASTKKGRPAVTYLLGGLIRCGRCGAFLHGRPRSSRPPYEDGEPAREYWCSGQVGRKGCGRLVIDMRFANGIVRNAVLDVLSDPQHVSKLEASAAESSLDRQKFEARLKELRSQLIAVAGKIPTRGLEWVEAASDNIELEIAKVQAKIDGLDTIEGPISSAARARDEWTRAEREGNLNLLRVMVSEAFPDLTIRPKPDGAYFKAAVQTVERFDWYGDSLPTL